MADAGDEGRTGWEAMEMVERSGWAPAQIHARRGKRPAGAHFPSPIGGPRRASAARPRRAAGGDVVITGAAEGEVAAGPAPLATSP
jgi:hypothetical protein